LAQLAGVSSRTIDYYTKLGLIRPEMRSDSNYRYYSDDTLTRLKQIEMLKKEKYSLDEIKEKLRQWDKAVQQPDMTDKLTSLQLHLGQLEKEVKELEPIIQQLKPHQMRKVYSLLTQPTAACIEALLFLLGKGPFS
jgi:MerR family transcriptional regulator, copper efflux regulator